MVDLTKLRQKDRRPCYVLRIAGLPVLYGTHMPPALSVEGIAHARRASIIPDSISFSRRHDENARVVEVSNLEIVLASDEQYTADQFDPGKVFGRKSAISTPSIDTAEHGKCMFYSATRIFPVACWQPLKT